MVARSQPSLRRSSRRGDQASNAAPVIEAHTEVQAQAQVQAQRPNAVTLSRRTKRNRITSISEAENLRKKSKTEHFAYASEYKFPLRNRPNHGSPRPLALQTGTRPVLSDQRKGTSVAFAPRQTYTSQTVDEKHQGQQRLPHTKDTRTLRSQDGGSRSKSELSMYFTNYEQMLSLEPPKLGKHITDNMSFHYN
jgi:hypothetical protein